MPNLHQSCGGMGHIARACPNGNGFSSAATRPSLAAPALGLGLNPIVRIYRLFTGIIDFRDRCLFCLCVEDNDKPIGTVFSVRINPRKCVHDLKDAVKLASAPRLDYLAAEELDIYTFSRPISLARITSEELSETIQNLDLSDKVHLNPASAILKSWERGNAPSSDQLYIIVSIPRPSPESSDVRIPELVRLLANNLLKPETSTSVTERGDNRPFKLALYNYYFNPIAIKYPDHLTCSLTGVTVSSKAIIATHLWKDATGRTRDYFNFEDIDDPRNGLLLYKPIEEAYNRHLLCFYQDVDLNICCRVLSPSLRTMTFDQFLPCNRNQRGSQTMDIEPSEVQKAVPDFEKAGFTTFGDLERSDVSLRFPMLREPFKQVLNIHSIRAHKLAVDRGDISLGEFEFDEFYSNETNYDGKAGIEFWRKEVAAATDNSSFHDEV